MSSVEVRVAPRHCDAQEMVYAGRYHDFVEDAFLQWLDDQDMPYDRLRAESLDLVIGTAVYRYHQPARLGDRLVISADASRSSRSTVTVDFSVQCNGDALAAVEVTYICVRSGVAAELPPALAAPSASTSPGDGGPSRLLERLHRAQSDFYAGADSTALAEVLHPEVVWRVPGANSIAGEYRGVDEVIAYMTRRRELSDRSFRIRGRELLVGPDHFASITDGVATVDGREHRWSTIGLYRARDDRIIECSLIPLDPVAFDRAWTAGPVASAP
jgi:YbgC/YbaW family acyl-CoA thioester hydrolase